VRQRSIAILTAMDLEADALCDRLEAVEWSAPVGIRLARGSLGETEVLLAISGIGKVAAALACQYLCDRHAPDAIVMAGLAGGLRSSPAVGALVVGTAAAHHDFDARPLTQAPGILPHLGLSAIPSDADLFTSLKWACDQAVAAREQSIPIFQGLIVSGDRIIDAASERDAICRIYPEALCVDMETAAVGQVAHQNAIPWAAVRMISDAADESVAVEEIVSFGHEVASEVLADVVVRLAARL